MILAAAGYANDLLQWTSLGILAVTIWRITRGGGGSAVQELSAANRVLEKRNHQLGAEVRDLRVRVAELEQRTDFATALERHETVVLEALDLIAQHLGAQRLR